MQQKNTVETPSVRFYFSAIFSVGHDEKFHQFFAKIYIF